MRLTLAALLIATVCAVCSPIPAQAVVDDGVIYGAGNASCGRWVEARRTKDFFNYTPLVDWTQGFITAASMAGFRLKEADGAAVRVFLDEYCERNPTDKINDAAYHLTMTLRY